MSDRLTVLTSKSVFTGTGDLPFEGFVAVRDNRIEAVGTKCEAASYLTQADEVVDLGDCTVMPGLIDVHTFYTGWALRTLGSDLSGIADAKEAVSLLRAWKEDHPDCAAAFGRNLPETLASDAENANTAAVFDAEVRAGYSDYMSMLNERGVTAIKEMAFDDYYGFADEMARREESGELTVRVSMMSQPVGAGANLSYAREARERFRGPFVRFSGFNRMTDRGVWAGLAEMIDPYEDTADAGAAGKTVVEEPEWDLIENELRAIDADGFRYSLHCQGDGAVRRTVALYASLPRDEHGRLLRRHAITDLENSDPTDLVEFGKLGGICEVYPQILTLDRREDCLSMMRRQIGETRLLHSWNRRGMEDSGCTVCCGTDLPLLIPSLGESIYSACGGYFDDGLPVNEANALTLVELLRAWTAGGAYDLMREDELGTLEVASLPISACSIGMCSTSIIATHAIFRLI